MKYFIFFTLLLVNLYGYADVYVQTDAQGNTIFSDTPLPNSKKLNDVTPLVPSTSTPSITLVRSLPSSTIASSNKPYTLFTIFSPTHQQTFQNQRDITVIIKIMPDLQTGDKIQLYLDGTPWGKAIASTQVSLSNIERGTHELYAVVINNAQQIMKQSAAVTFYIHYASTKN